MSRRQPAPQPTAQAAPPGPGSLPNRTALLSVYPSVRTIFALLASLALAQAADLHEAARECDPDRMQQVLTRRPRLNEKDVDGRTPLHVAIDARQVDCVSLLLDAGADRFARDRKGRTGFGAAAEIDDQRTRGAMNRLLLGNPQIPTGGDPDASAGPPPWSLEYAVLHRQTALTKMLLDLGADPNSLGTKGTTPLADAALAEGDGLQRNQLQ